MGFPRQAYWSGLLFPPPGDLPDPGVESWSRLGVQNGDQTLEHLCGMGSGSGAPLMAQLVKNPPAKQETLVRSLGWEDPL